MTIGNSHGNSHDTGLDGSYDRGAFKALISGRVQGVGFRFQARRKAGSLSLRGWVRNERDGSVTVLAEGYKENLNEFSSWLRKGPPGSWVREFEMEELPYTGSFIDFEIEY